MTDQKFHRPTGRSVWTATELSRRDDWVFRFSPATLREFDERLAQVKARGLKIEDIRAGDFPLESLADDLDALREEIATGRGFVVMRGLDPDRYAIEDLTRIYWAIGAHLGVAMTQSYLGDMIGDIRDVSDEEPDPRKRRGYRSGGAQPVHTDSCDIVAMLSIRLAKEGGESVLASAHTVHNIMLDNAPGLLRAFYDGFMLRGTDTDAAARGRPALFADRVPGYKFEHDWLNCFFVRGYVERAVKAGDVKLSAVEQAAVETFTGVSNNQEVCLRMLLEPGDMQFVNNRTMLHGRAHFEDHPEKERRRHLLRLWLAVPEWPRLPAAQDIHGNAEKLAWQAAASARDTLGRRHG